MSPAITGGGWLRALEGHLPIFKLGGALKVPGLSGRWCEDFAVRHPSAVVALTDRGATRLLPVDHVGGRIITRHRGDIDALVSVDSEQAIAEMRRLAKRFGLFVGPSSGAHLVAARTLKQEHDDTEHVVTFLCDEGEKYINDYFLT
jgi:Pyridoxal-phosphate dependent enzyme